MIVARWILGRVAARWSSGWYATIIVAWLFEKLIFIFRLQFLCCRFVWCRRGIGFIAWFLFEIWVWFWNFWLFFASIRKCYLWLLIIILDFSRCCFILWIMVSLLLWFCYVIGIWILFLFGGLWWMLVWRFLTRRRYYGFSINILNCWRRGLLIGSFLRPFLMVNFISTLGRWALVCVWVIVCFFILNFDLLIKFYSNLSLSDLFLAHKLISLDANGILKMNH